MKRLSSQLLLAALIVLSTLSFAQSVNNKGTKEQDSCIITTTAQTCRFNDNLGTQFNQWEMKITGSPATNTTTVVGCMRGGTCSSTLVSSTSTSSALLVVTGGGYDYYVITTTFTGGSSPTFTFNRTGTVARSPTGGGSGTVTNIATTGPITGGPISTTGTIACATCTVTIASGTATLGTGAISNGTCATVVTVTATGTATTDIVAADFDSDPSGVTGYNPTAGAQSLTIFKYPTTNNVNFKVCNFTASSITPGARTLNWRVMR